MNKTSVISLSGGIDSTSLLLHLLTKHYNIYAISFDYGQNHKIEINRAKQNITYLNSKGYTINHEIINISDCKKLLSSSLTNQSLDIPEGFYEEKNMLSTVVPNRNAIFSSILYGYALTVASNTGNNVSLCLGVHSGDHAIYPDCRLEFYNKIMDAFKAGNWESDKIKLYLPYINFNKTDILENALESVKQLKLDFNTIFKNTITSYNPDKNGISSGKTGSDIERILAFDSIGIIDPIKYKDKWEIVLAHAKKIELEYKKNN